MRESIVRLQIQRAGAVILFVALAPPLLAATATAFAQQSAKIPRIGYLLQSPLTEPPSPERQAFLDGLRELGYINGKNIQILYRSAEAEPEFLPDMAADLVKEHVDIIVTVGTLPSKAARDATRTVPIVLASHLDPVGGGLVTSLAHPGGNITGLTLMAPELGAKRVELLHESLPKARRIAVLRNPNDIVAREEWQAAQQAASQLKVALESFPAKNADELALAFRHIAGKPPDALLVISDLRMDSYRSVIVEFAAKHRIPVIAGRSEFTLIGGMMSYAPSVPELFRRAATYADKILRGARPRDLPIEQPTKLELAINLKTAKALGITIPNSILVRADRVIE